MAPTMTPAQTLREDIAMAMSAARTAFEHAHAVNEELHQEDEAVRETLAQVGAGLAALTNAYRRAQQIGNEG